MQIQSQQKVEASDISIKNYWSSNNAQAIVESLVDPLLILDEHGIIIEVNSYAEELFEYSREELIGKINISHLIPHLNLENEGNYILILFNKFSFLIFFINYKVHIFIN